MAGDKRVVVEMVREDGTKIHMVISGVDDEQPRIWVEDRRGGQPNCFIAVNDDQCYPRAQ